MLLKVVFLFVIIFQQFLLADTTYWQRTGLIKRLSSQFTIKDVAFSEDGRYLLVSSERPFSLKLYKVDDLSLLKQHWLSAAFGKSDTNPNLTDFIFDSPSRQSFIAGFGSANQLWEILYADNPLPVYNGVMHDYRMNEGLVREQGHFPTRIIKLAENAGNQISSYYFIAESGMLLIARSKTIEAIQLDARKTIATIDTNGIPDLYSSYIDTINDTPHLFVPFLNGLNPKRVNLKNWTVID